MCLSCDIVICSMLSEIYIFSICVYMGWQAFLGAFGVGQVTAVEYTDAQLRGA